MVAEDDSLKYRAKSDSWPLGGEATLRGFPAGSIFQREFGIEEVRGVIDSFAVREKIRHQGMASALLDWRLESGVTRIETLGRWIDWELLQFFEYVGFRPSSRIDLMWRFR